MKAIASILILFAASGYLWGGEPAWSPATIPSRPTPLPHRFFDRQNTALLFAGAGLRALDTLTTRQMMPRGADEYLLPRALVSSTPRLAVFSGGMVAATGGLMYLAHRTNHHRLERGLGWAQVGFIGGCVTNNVIWLHQHWAVPLIYERR